MLNNVDIAILNQVNRLAEQFSVDPSGFVATLQMDDANGKTILTFETGPSGRDEKAFQRMLKAIGADNKWRISAYHDELYRLLAKASANVPRMGRGR